VLDLRSRGYENAGLYDPPGVGGTHVMYVLQHADQPELYQELPKNPKISRITRLWEGGAKAFGFAVMGLGLVGGFLHYITVGPTEVPAEAEGEAMELERKEKVKQATQQGARR
jgi:formate dehydrogenase iron-sulfur subunit